MRAVLQHPAIAARFGAELAKKFEKVDVVASPAVGGLIIGHEVARALEARFIFTERDAAGKMTLRRGFHVAPGETVVVIEDVVTTGGSTREVVELLEAAGAKVLGAGSIIDRSGGKADVGVPRFALETLNVTSWPADDCPLCKDGVPVEKPGSRTDRQFAAKMRRIRITVSYDGTNYRGWQVQPGQPTIELALEMALSEIEGSPVDVKGSGRTDSGVHALAQVAAFDFANPIPVDKLRKAVNRLLPRDIRVMDVAEAAPNFHPRFDAKAKTYEYRIWRPEICPPFERLYVLHHPFHLNEACMMEAAPMLEGEHDFSAFAAADEKDVWSGSKVRRVFSSRLAREGDRLIYRVRGAGFLKHMVRNIVGVLIEVGKGNFTHRDVAARLEAGCESRRDRRFLRADCF